jgi:catechol 2,3-dioxygenase-like lactoylglutathione lyase family enzyme
MFADTEAFSGFAVDDLEKAQRFYGETLGIRTTLLDEENGLLTLHLAGGRDTLVYRSPGFTPASYTMLNFRVDDIDAAVDELTGRGVSFERYDEFPQDEKGVMREDGPFIAWFKDPAGNTLSVLQER